MCDPQLGNGKVPYNKNGGGIFGCSTRSPKTSRQTYDFFTPPFNYSVSDSQTALLLYAPSGTVSTYPGSHGLMRVARGLFTAGRPTRPPHPTGLHFQTPPAARDKLPQGEPQSPLLQTLIQSCGPTYLPHLHNPTSHFFPHCHSILKHCNAK